MRTAVLASACLATILGCAPQSRLEDQTVVPSIDGYVMEVDLPGITECGYREPTRPDDCAARFPCNWIDVSVGLGKGRREGRRWLALDARGGPYMRGSPLRPIMRDQPEFWDNERARQNRREIDIDASVNLQASIETGLSGMTRTSAPVEQQCVQFVVDQDLPFGEALRLHQSLHSMGFRSIFILPEEAAQ